MESTIRSLKGSREACCATLARRPAWESDVLARATIMFSRTASAVGAGWGVGVGAAGAPAEPPNHRP